jgi:hypothetical protein
LNHRYCFRIINAFHKYTCTSNKPFCYSATKATCIATHSNHQYFSSRVCLDIPRNYFPTFFYRKVMFFRSPHLFSVLLTPPPPSSRTGI